MTGVTIRLPTAAPEAYLAWVTWWREVEQLLGSDLATAPGDDDGLAPDRGARSIVLQHVRSLEEQAKQASEEGKQTISPELSAEPAEWDQWLGYWGNRREWLEALARRGTRGHERGRRRPSLREGAPDRQSTHARPLGPYLHRQQGPRHAASAL